MPRVRKEWIQATPKNVKKGMRCRVKPSLWKRNPQFTPTFEWGRVGYSEEGFITLKYWPSERGHAIKVDFPSQRYWTALTSEMEVYVGVC